MTDPFTAYHDATLEAIELSWDSGRVTLKFLLADGRRTIVIEQAEAVECPRLQPWGQSVSVNGIRIKETSGGCELELEMQSGDVIRVRGQRIEAAPAEIPSKC
jgi:hypothetical protein